MFMTVYPIIERLKLQKTRESTKRPVIPEPFKRFYETGNSIFDIPPEPPGMCPARHVSRLSSPQHKSRKDLAALPSAPGQKAGTKGKTRKQLREICEGLPLAAKAEFHTRRRQDVADKCLTVSIILKPSDTILCRNILDKPYYQAFTRHVLASCLK
jgi:hypothetical protein